MPKGEYERISDRHMYQINCLGCMNLVMCGRNEKKDVMVKCLLGILAEGELITLRSVIQRKHGAGKKCPFLEKMRPERDVIWKTYIQQLKENFL